MKNEAKYRIKYYVSVFYTVFSENFTKNDKGRMNPDSSDDRYTELLKNLRQQLKVLAKKIEPKVYEYEFLKR